MQVLPIYEKYKYRCGGAIMEQSTKTILWVLAFITLPLTIPLALISLSIVIGFIFVVLAIIMSCPFEIMAILIIIVMIFVVSKWLYRNG